MQKRSFLVGLGTGFSAGYSAYRFYSALTEIRRPSARRLNDAAGYGRARRALTVAGIARSLFGTAAFAYGGGSRRLAVATQPRLRGLHACTFTAASLALASLLDLPLDFVEGYCLERKHNLTEQTPRAWLTDHLKEAGISIAVASALAGLFAAAVRRFRARWPLVASAGMLPLAILANVIVPLYILPLFNRFEPLNGGLEDRLRALAARYGVGDAEILRMDVSRQTKKANAFVTGVGTTHRIVLGDTLLEHFTDDEITFVVAHELGHYVSKDSWRMIAASTLYAAGIFGTVSFLVRNNVRERPGDPVTLTRIFFWFTALSQIASPALAAFSRSREWSADSFAITATHAPKDGAAAFRRLRDQNLAEDEQPAWYELLFATHPSLKARIAALEARQFSSRTAGR